MYLGKVQKLWGSGCFPLSRLIGFRPTEAVLIPNTSVLWVIFLSVLRSESSKRDVFLCGFSWNECISSRWMLGHFFSTRISPLCWPWPQMARTEGAEARVKASRLLWRSGPGLEIELGGVKEAWSRSPVLKSYWRVLELVGEFIRLWENQKLGGV